MKSSEMHEKVKDAFNASLTLHRLILDDQVLHAQLVKLAEWCIETIQNGGKIIFAGNGGSFADSQHLAAEFVSRLQFDRAPLPSIALATNSSNMSAIGNDYGFEQVFVREIVALGRSGDVFIPITTSGNSPNILSAVESAKEKGIRVMGLTGKSGGHLLNSCPCICIPADRTERIQEGHILVGHVLCALVESSLFEKE